MPRRKRAGIAITLTDVARLAGVSAITVSRALNTPGQLAAETLERVREAVQRTGYVPNLLAGGLRSSRSRMIAAVVPTISGAVFLETIQALTETLREKGYHLMLGQSGYANAGDEALLDAIIGRRPDGIVLTGILHSDAGRNRLLASGIPVVETWDLTPTPIDMLVGFSHEHIGEAVCEFLHGKGRQRPVAISGDDSRALRRVQGFARAAARLGMPKVPVKTVPAPTTLGAGREGLANALARNPDLDAIFCSSDLLALGVLTEARARGLAVPGQLSIMGFGDLQFAAGLDPPLSTVRVDGTRIGRLAATLLMDRAEGRTTREKIHDVGFSVVERGSA